MPQMENSTTRGSQSLRQILDLLKQARALLEQFQKEYERVWNEYIPSVELRLADAETLVPKMAFLVNEHKIRIGCLKSMYDILVQMKKNITFTIDPDKVQQALQEHGQAGDLLDRATKSIQDVILLMHVRVDDDRPSPFVQDVKVYSANEIMAASVIFMKYLEDAVLNPASSEK